MFKTNDLLHVAAGMHVNLMRCGGTWAGAAI